MSLRGLFSVLGLSLVDSLTLLSPVLIWKLNIYPQTMFIHWSVSYLAIRFISNCVVKKSNFSLPSPPLLYYFLFPIPYLERNSTGFSYVERADSVIKAIFVWSPSGYICVKPTWLYLWEAHLAIFVRRPSGNLCEAHLAICEKLIWLFVRSLSGYFWEAHLACLP